MDFLFIKSKAKGFEEYGSIYVRVRNNGQNVKVVTGLKIKEAEWIKIRTLRYVPTQIMPSVSMKYHEFVTLLQNIKLGIENNLSNPDKYSDIIRKIKTEIIMGDVADTIAPKISSLPLVKFVEQYCDDLKSGKRLKHKSVVKVSQGYVLKIVATLNHLKQYEEEKQTVVYLDDVDMRFQRSFVLYLKEKGLMQNTICSNIGVIRRVMQVAYQEKLTTSNDFQNPEFVPGTEDVDSIWLRPEQIERLMKMDLSSQGAIIHEYIKNNNFIVDSDSLISKLPNKTKIKDLGYVRDVFVVGCLTGQRYSDYSRLCGDMIIQHNGIDFFSIYQKKTGIKVLIPVDIRVREILDKYQGKLPKVSVHCFNALIKYIGELAGWTNIPQFDVYHSERPEQRFCDMISSHTARRSFATNAYAAGVPLRSIMAVTGHTSEESLKTYLKLQAEDKAILAVKDFDNIYSGIYHNMLIDCL